MARSFRSTASGAPRDTGTLAKALDARFDQLYGCVDRLQQLHLRLVGAGFRESALPAEVDRQAYALLGDHHRPEILAELAPSELELLEKGLIIQPLDQLPTPDLRLLSTAVPFLPQVQALRERIATAMETAQTDSRNDFGVYLPEQPIRATRFQIVRITGFAVGCEWLLVRPDAVFGVRETLLQSQGQGEFDIEVTCATGAIAIAALNQHGQVLLKHVHVEATPLWSNLSMSKGGHA